MGPSFIFDKGHWHYHHLWLIHDLFTAYLLTKIEIKAWINNYIEAFVMRCNYYRNWPRYGLRWSGWYCHQAQHELCRPSRGRLRPAGTTSAVPDGSTTHDSADRISGQFLFYHDHNFTKSKGNLRFQRHVPLFVPIGVCVTTHDDGTASDVTIGMWRHNQQATNHERNGKPWFSFPK